MSGIYPDDEDEGEPAVQRVKEVVADTDGTTHVDANAVAAGMRRGPTTARDLRPEFVQLPDGRVVQNPLYRAGAEWTPVGSKALPVHPYDPRFGGQRGQAPASVVQRHEGHTDPVELGYDPRDMRNSGSVANVPFPDYVVEQAVSMPVVPAYVGPWLTAKIALGERPSDKIMTTLGRRVFRDVQVGTPPDWVAAFLYVAANLGQRPPPQLLAAISRNPAAGDLYRYCQQLGAA